MRRIGSRVRPAPLRHRPARLCCRLERRPSAPPPDRGRQPAAILEATMPAPPEAAPGDRSDADGRRSRCPGCCDRAEQPSRRSAVADGARRPDRRSELGTDRRRHEDHHDRRSCRVPGDARERGTRPSGEHRRLPQSAHHGAHLAIRVARKACCSFAESPGTGGVAATKQATCRARSSARGASSSSVGGSG